MAFLSYYTQAFSISLHFLFCVNGVKSMTFLSSPISFGHFKLFSVKFYSFSNYLTIDPFADVLFHFSVPSLIFKNVYHFQHNFSVKMQREKNVQQITLRRLIAAGKICQITTRHNQVRILVLILRCEVQNCY